MALSCFKIRNFILSASLVSGLALGTQAIAGEAFLVDLNSRTATALGTLGGDFSSPYGINDAGQVVGRSLTAGGEIHAFITGPDGAGIRDLGTFGNSSEAYGINEAGQVVGFSYTTGREYHAFITGPDGMGMRNLGTLGTLGHNRTHAYDINDAGKVVGISYMSATDPHAFITGPDGAGMKDLGTLSGVEKLSINDTGQVAGDSWNRAFITGPDGVSMRDLGTLGGGISSASGINDAGQVVGQLTTARQESHAFITGPDGVGMRDLGTLGGGFSSASGINEAGQVVGRSDTAEGLSHAFITGPDGMGMMDLNSLVDLPQGLILIETFDINNNGQVIAVGIPEPETYALMLAGLGLIGFMARRKKMENS